MSATKTTFVAVLVLMLTFGAGVIAGAAAHHLWDARGGGGVHPFMMKPMINRLDRRLDLTDAQRAQIEAILRRRHANIMAAWSGVRPRVRAELEATNAEIAKVLTPEQRAKFQRMRFHLGALHGRREDTAQTAPTR